MENITKVCSKCKVEKPCSDFCRHKSTKDGLNYWCRECTKKYQEENSERMREYRKENSERKREYCKKYYQENIERMRERSKKYQLENIERIRERNKKHQEENPEGRREYYKQYRQENIERIRQYRKENSERRREYSRKYQKERSNSDPLFKMINYLRNRVGSYCRAIKVNKSTRTKQMIGVDLTSFKSYMESKFQEGMTWGNYGQWHVDHIKPLSLATTEQEIIELNHYTNLQPLWADENLKKSNKYEESH